MNRLRTSRALALSLVFTFFAAALPAAADPADVYGESLLIRNKGASTYCLDATLSRGAEGRGVYIYKCTGRDNQRWTFTHGVDGNGAIVAFDGKCLDVRGRHVHDNTPVQVWNCHYGANQEFVVLPTGEIKEAVSGKCLTIGDEVADRNPVYIDDCQDHLKQQWTIGGAL